MRTLSSKCLTSQAWLVFAEEITQCTVLIVRSTHKKEQICGWNLFKKVSSSIPLNFREATEL